MRLDWLRGVGLALLLIGPGLLSGCIFDPRVPESGGGDACFVAAAPSTPDQVLDNLDGSFDCLQASTYIQQIGEEFVYIPSASTRASFPQLFATENSWGKEQETAFMEALSSSAQAVESHLLEFEIERSGTEFVTVEARYRVVITTDGSEIEYTGEAFYTFEQVATLWVMVRWEEKEATSPLGSLKASLVNGR